VTAKPGGGPPLHRHKYDEVVYVISGRARWTVNGQEREAEAGDVFVVKAGEAHKFVSSQDDPVRQIDIHLNATFEQEALE
jgi:quercetin dioxygenase-like cupin family protein